MKDIILLPTYNERESVKLIIPEIFGLLPGIYILVIDDNSPDRTADEVKKLMQLYSHLSILERPKKTGLGNAYADAMKRVIEDKNVRSIITMDADGSHSPRCLGDFFAQINGYDLIIGSRYVGGGGFASLELWRKILSRGGNLYAKILTGLPINDLTSGFMCIKREFLEQVNFDEISSSGYSFLIELKFYLINKLGVRVKEISIIFKGRKEGETKLSNQIIFEGMRTPWRLLRKRLWKK